MISFDFNPNGEAVAAIDRYGMCTISDTVLALLVVRFETFQPLKGILGHTNFLGRMQSIVC